MELETLRHSAAHIMAQAVKSIWPDVKVAIGPSIADGFYYDFDKKEPFLPEDLPKIEEKMKKIVKDNQKFEKKDISKEEALELFRSEPYKLELIKEIPDETVSVYSNGDFTDLCKGPHVGYTKKVKAFKLLSIAGAYWRGDEKNQMLQRIYGTAFSNKEELAQHLHALEEAKKRDHRKLGKELELFTIDESAGAGLVIYRPKGALLRTLIEDWEKREHLKRGYDLIVSPHILKSDIWVRSGHYDFYKEHMYIFKVEDDEYAVKPMNCPGHMIAYKAKKRSYRDLPLRLFELGSVYRHEKSGVLHGLLRVRGFTQDDSHIFCLPEQLRDEIKAVIDFVIDSMKVFGFDDYMVEISTRPKESIGTDKDWENATAALEDSLKDKKIAYEINEGDGAFYGPKIDIKLKDAIGRFWQCATIQCDFALAERFDLTYVDQDGQEKRPVMIHRVILGSLERFIGTLIEHYAGAFPLWLAPVQAVVIPITDKQYKYAKRVNDAMADVGLRTKLDDRKETMGYKIREAQTQKIPYMVIVGQKEQEKEQVSVRSRQKGDEGQRPIDKFLARLKMEIEKKQIVGH